MQSDTHETNELWSESYSLLRNNISAYNSILSVFFVPKTPTLFPETLEEGCHHNLIN